MVLRSSVLTPMNDAEDRWRDQSGVVTTLGVSVREGAGCLKGYVAESLGDTCFELHTRARKMAAEVHGRIARANPYGVIPSSHVPDVCVSRLLDPRS